MATAVRTTTRSAKGTASADGTAARLLDEEDDEDEEDGVVPEEEGVCSEKRPLVRAGVVMLLDERAADDAFRS